MRKFLSFALILVLVPLVIIGLTSCKGEKGDPGPVGPKGGIQIDGWASGIEKRCGECHDPEQDTVYYVKGRVYQWAVSEHAIGGEYARSQSTCSPCHTTEGFIAAIDGKAAANYPIPSPLGCFSCHSPHGKGDFSLRGNKQPVPLNTSTNIIGVAAQTFDYGTGNLCVQCHKPRTVTPAMNGNAAGDSLRITTSRWYPHYGVQGEMLMGVGGFEGLPGFTSGNTFHTTAPAIKENGCAICHMAEGVSTPILGGHTMWLRSQIDTASTVRMTVGCNLAGCHSNITTLDYKGAQTKIHKYLDTLQALLLAKGYITTTNSVNASTSRPLVIRPAKNAGAMWNYFFVEHDLSFGVHNTKYAEELLKSSIQQLRSN